MLRIRTWDGRRGRIVVACAALIAGLSHASAARASAPHVVTAGETLWSISSANGLTSESVAAFNGISADTLVIEGQTILVPSTEEGGVVSGTTVAAPATDTTDAITDTTGGGHTVIYGETLSSIAAANGVTVADLAASNGLDPAGILAEGTALSVPAPTAAAAAVAPPGTAPVPSPTGDVYLDPAAADSWNAMKNDSLSNYGVDLYPAGPLSGYRTPEQQQQLYDLYLAGEGPPANPPGTSSHELGVAVDLAEPIMRDVIDEIGYAYGWAGTIPSEWWHVAHGG